MGLTDTHYYTENKQGQGTTFTILQCECKWMTVSALTITTVMGKVHVCVYIYVLNHSDAHLKLMQRCKWMTFKFKKKMNKEKNTLLSLSTLHHLNQLEATGQGAHWFGLHKAPPVTQQGRQREESVWGTNRRQSAHVLKGFALKLSWRGNLRHWQLKYQWGMETLEC